MRDKNIPTLTDRAFLRRTAFYFAAIILCIACLCGTTLAWYTASSTDEQNAAVTAAD